MFLMTFLLGRGRWNVGVMIDCWGRSWLGIDDGNLSKSIVLKRSIERKDGLGGKSWLCNELSNKLGEIRICNSTLGGCWGVSIFGCIVRNVCPWLVDNDSRRASVFSGLFDSRICK